jgi:hypothetical protein
MTGKRETRNGEGAKDGMCSIRQRSWKNTIPVKTGRGKLLTDWRNRRHRNYDEISHRPLAPGRISGLILERLRRRHNQVYYAALFHGLASSEDCC